MRYAAFFRNLNLGRANCPTRIQFETAFLEAGADAAASFLVNGTLVYEAPTAARAQAVVDDACRRLHAACGLAEPVFVRTVPYLAALVASDPFAGVDRAAVYACCVSFLHDPSVTPPAPGLTTPRADVAVIAVTPAEVLCVSRQVMKAPGSPNAFLERRLGSPLTTRDWNTVVRLVDRFG